MGEAKTAVLVHQEQSGAFTDGVMVFEADKVAEISLTEGTSHLFAYRESVKALGVPVGVAFEGSGDAGPEPILAFSRGTDGWAPLVPPNPDRYPLSIFHPVTPCDRIVATGMGQSHWRQEMLRGVDLGDGRMLLADRAGTLFRLEIDDRLVDIGRIGPAPIALTSDDQGRSLLVFDDRGRLERWDVATLTSTVIVADASGLQLSPDMVLPVASLFVSRAGEIHVAMSAVSTIGGPNENRTAIASQGQWQRWSLDDCGREATSEVTQSNRLAQTSNDDVISLGNCQFSHLRRQPNGTVFKEVLPGIDAGMPFVVRPIRGAPHIGTRAGRIYRERTDSGTGWEELAAFGSATLDDLAPFGPDGLIAALRYDGFTNNLRVWFPFVGPIGHCQEPEDTRYIGVTTNLVQRRDYYLAATSSTGGYRFAIHLAPPPE